MPRLRSTLVPLDGSPFAERAVAYAAELATAAEASLLLVRTAESSRHPHPGQQNAREHQAQVYLGQMRRRLHGTGVAAGVAVPPGHTSDALLAEVDRQKPDLIVVTSHGHSGFRRMVLDEGLSCRRHRARSFSRDRRSRQSASHRSPQMRARLA